MVLTGPGPRTLWGPAYRKRVIVCISSRHVIQLRWIHTVSCIVKQGKVPLFPDTVGPYAGEKPALGSRCDCFSRAVWTHAALHYFCCIKEGLLLIDCHLHSVKYLEMAIRSLREFWRRFRSFGNDVSPSGLVLVAKWQHTYTRSNEFCNERIVAWNCPM